MATIAARRQHAFVRRVGVELQRQGLIPANARVLVAVSGGPDSVGLLAVLQELGHSRHIPGLALHAAHMNYGLRGRESDEDAAFVSRLGTRFGIPVHVERADLDGLRGASLQAHARHCRYAFFERLCRSHGLSHIATGHTADDQAETILMWLLRGCGPKGLAGIPIMREGRIIRPLLHVRRSEILDYLATRALTYRSDSSNATRIYQRNRIRHDLLPQLQAFNPRLVEAFVRTAELLREEAALLEEVEQAQWSAILIESTPGRVVLDGEGFAQTPVALQRRLVRRAWKAVRGNSAGLTYRHVASVLRQFVERTGEASVNLPGGICAGRLGNRVIMESDHRQTMDDDPPWEAGVPLPVPGSVALGQGRRVRAEVASHSPEAEDAGPDRLRFTMCADVSQTTLIVRRRQPGDWFCPTGMAGRKKKLQDFFVDQKVPRRRRDQVPLVVAPGGIVWVGGYRGDERFRLRSHTSRSVRLFLEEDE